MTFQMFDNLTKEIKKADEILHFPGYLVMSETTCCLCCCCCCDGTGGD